MMQRYSISTFIHLGTVIRYLQDASKHYDPSIEDGILDSLELAKNSCEIHGLRVSATWAERLDPLIYELSQIGRGGDIGPELTQRLRSDVGDWLKVIYAECDTVLNFLATDKRYSGELLIDNPWVLLREDMFYNMPDIARDDFKEACLCILFERGTAAAFHLLRCTEAVLKDLYKAHIKRNRLDDHKQNWGAMCIALEAKTREKPSPELMEQLSVLRRNFRNPTQHPEKSYDVNEAQNLLASCIDAIERMCADKKYEAAYEDRLLE